MRRSHSLVHGRWFYSPFQGQKHSNCDRVRNNSLYSLFLFFVTVPVYLLFTFQPKVVFTVVSFWDTTQAA